MKEAVEFVRLHWKGIRTMQGVAASFRVDPANLTRCFRYETGATPKRFLDDRRKEYVIEHLRRGNLLGYQVGAQLGFGDDLSFYRWVKRAFGLSYRNLLTEIHNEKWEKAPYGHRSPRRVASENVSRGSNAMSEFHTMKGVRE